MHSQFSVRFSERNGAFEFAGVETRAVLRVIDRLIFLRENRLDAGRFENLSATSVRSDFDNRGAHITDLLISLTLSGHLSST